MANRNIALATIVLTAGVVASLAVAGEAPELSGAELYSAFCASCHGDAAHGDGPMAPLLKIPVPDLTHIAARRDGKFSPKEMQRIIDGRFLIAAHGSRDMPLWGNEFFAYDGQDPIRRRQASKRIAELVAYLGSIQTIRID